MEVKLVWATDDVDAKIAYIARVSNPANQNNPSIEGLLRYMMREGHVSPFEMANVCLEINAPRDIVRQMIRHKSLAVQEFSQRYSTYDALSPLQLREFRLQDQTNRQASIECNDRRMLEWFEMQRELRDQVSKMYDWALKNGGAKEVARVILPEGMTMSRAYFNGNMRSWIHYLQARTHESTQKEHREVANLILSVLRTVAPITMSAFFD
jgi:thymidylate synthase (FAD)